MGVACMNMCITYSCMPHPYMVIIISDTVTHVTINY